MLKSLLSFILFIVVISLATGQPTWIDKVYATETIEDVHYGDALDYAGTIRDLRLDIAYPLDDTPPECGRPFMLIIHGGAWLGGDKAEGYPAQLLKDFAARGYVTASINYRLGMFQTEKMINCNISGLNGLQWNCLNITDSLEWTRAWYRAVQDAKGALRYMMEQADDFQIDRRNVFVVGESAGAFTALGVVYLDVESEKPSACLSINDVPPPHSIYENPCILSPGFANGIDSMDYGRADLGPIQGTLHPDVDSFVIKGCGDLYGGLFFDLFSQKATSNIPALYMYHQPADLIVPINYGSVLAGFSACASSIGGCQAIYGRPYVYGSNAVANLLQNLEQDGLDIPVWMYEKSNNNASCLEQILNPALGGHSLDNYELRTDHMATYFAQQMDLSSSCLTTSIYPEVGVSHPVRPFPNPVREALHVPGLPNGAPYVIHDLHGRKIMSGRLSGENALDVSTLPAGMYGFQWTHKKGSFFFTFIKL